MHYIITGNCGFIGANLVNYLLKQGIKKIRIIDNCTVGKQSYLESAFNEFGSYKVSQRENGVTNKFANCEVEFIIGDIRDAQFAIDATKEIDMLVHLTAQSGVLPSIQNPGESLELNVNGTYNYLEAAKKMVWVGLS